ncbi:hypothetical protein BU16DRAFT_556885 [Lophium mytilinum]|uniref:F-box domain-containing protein n=1 Tax=Lophium mytilinum TaxID=390894 RepID=A0A6A6R6I1_9PEZI|nr:hypothetical protein BU16DRAFT_556885 [Lophium mytilinum]
MEEQPVRASQLGEITYACPTIKDYTLDDNLPVLMAMPNDGQARKQRAVDLGVLDVLPLELLQALLCQLDLRTLTDFGYVNRRATEVVGSIPQYKAAATNAPSLLRGILAIESGPWITCEALYEKLCTAECEQCGDFGSYLYIFTCKRVCFRCLSLDDRFRPLLRSHAIQKFGINDQILDTLPYMRSLPGTYSPHHTKSPKILALVDPESAYNAGIALHGSASAMEQYTSRHPRQPHHSSLNALRFVAIIHTPWLDRASQELHWGFHCIGCKNNGTDGPLNWRRKFSAASFNEHLKQHGNIRDGKHHLE